MSCVYVKIVGDTIPRLIPTLPTIKSIKVTVEYVSNALSIRLYYKIECFISESEYILCITGKHLWGSDIKCIQRFDSIDLMPHQNDPLMSFYRNSVYFFMAKQRVYL